MQVEIPAYSIYMVIVTSLCRCLMLPACFTCAGRLDERISESSSQELAKQLNITYTSQLEKRIRKELEDQSA